MRKPLLVIASVVLATSPRACARCDIASIADETSERLPPTDDVHRFLDLLDDLARIER